MEELTNTQILYIENDLKSKGLIQKGILDHICCLVEQKMINGMSFSNAFKESLGEFEDDNFQNLKKSIHYKSLNQRIMNSKIVSTGIAACIFMFVFVVEAQDIPNIKPVSNEFGITSEFGRRYHPILKLKKMHNGVDIKAPMGTEIKATANGIIEKIEEKKGYGKYIVIKHGNEYSTLYATLSEFKVIVGQKVIKGQVIALSGNSGVSTAPHLHYEVIKEGKKVNPSDYFETE